MRNRIVILTVLACASTALFVAGCGDDEEPAESTALTEGEFIAQGNEICAAGEKEIEAIANDVFTGREPTPEQLENYAALFVENVQGQIDAIGALTPPELLAEQVDSFLSDAEDVLAQVEDDPSLLAVSDTEGPFADVNEQATEIGLTECAG